MKTETTYMMLFRYSPDPEAILSPEDLKEMEQSWGAFIGGIAIQEKLVSTYQLGFEGKVVAQDSSVSHNMHLANGQMVSGNMTITANSLEEAVEISKGCPILTMGGSVEIRNIIPMGN